MQYSEIAKHNFYSIGQWKQLFSRSQSRLVQENLPCVYRTCIAGLMVITKHQPS